MNTLNSIITTIQSRLANFENRYAAAGCIITSTPFIVCSQDGFYSVKTNNENYCQVEMNVDSPHMFDLATASLIVEGFKPENGNGPIKLVIMSEREFLAAKIKEFQEVLKNIIGD